MSSVLSQLVGSPQTNQGVCLGFHSIGKNPVAGIARPDIVTTPVALRSMLEEASRLAEPVSLNIAKFPSAWFAVSFDDGFVDNLTEALPILEQLRIPALVSPTVGFVERSVPPYELVLARTLDDRQASRQLGLGVDASLAEKREVYESFRMQYKFSTKEERAHLLKQLPGVDVLIDDIFALYLTRDQLKELSDHPLITIGSHGMSHICLSAQQDAVVCTEMARSKAWIERETSQRCEVFVLPYGALGDCASACSKQVGYRRLVTTRPVPTYGAEATTVQRFMCDGLSTLSDEWNSVVALLDT